jgi:hypothetical protein
MDYRAAAMTSADATHQVVADGEGASELDALDEFSEKLNAFKAFRSSDSDAADKLFESLGGRGKVEQEMLLQLGAWLPLYKPDRFEQSHQVVMRALEVLYRNGHRKAPVKLGAATPIAQYFVQLVTRFVVRDHVKNVVRSLTNLYVRRWTSAPKDTRDAAMLRRAWMQVEKVAPGYGGGSIGIPTFLVGGAFASSLTGLLSNIGSTGGSNKGSNKIVLVVIAIVLYALLVALAYGVIRGAAIGRRRIKMALDQPLKHLWDVVGAAGDPPKDQARMFALVSLIVMALAAVAVPLIAAILFFAS